jgi:hypothetical protein
MCEITYKNNTYQIILPLNANKGNYSNKTVTVVGKRIPNLLNSTITIEYKEGRYICRYSVFYIGLYINEGSPHIDDSNIKDFRKNYTFELFPVGVVYVYKNFIWNIIEYNYLMDTGLELNKLFE